MTTKINYFYVEAIHDPPSHIVNLTYDNAKFDLNTQMAKI